MFVDTPTAFARASGNAPLYLTDASDTLKGAFDKAFKQERKTKFEDAKSIVEALSQVDQDGASKAVNLDKVNELSPQYPMPRLTT